MCYIQLLEIIFIGAIIRTELCNYLLSIFSAVISSSSLSFLLNREPIEDLLAGESLAGTCGISFGKSACDEICSVTVTVSILVITKSKPFVTQEYIHFHQNLTSFNCLHNSTVHTCLEVFFESLTLRHLDVFI